MTSSTPADPLAAEAVGWAEALLGQPVTGVRRGGAGGNNRIYRVETADGPFCLKLYPRLPGDPRDRLGAEFNALSFLGRHGVSVVPQAIAADPAAGYGLYSWLDAARVEGPGETELDALLDFVDLLDRLREAPDAQALPPAAEACLSPAELVR